MPMDCVTLKGLMRSFSFIADCQTLPDGTLRIATPFRYSNGSLIDVFVEHDKGLFGGGYTVSDYAQTLVMLLNMHIDIMKTKKRRQLIEDICEALAVKEIESQFTVF